MTNRVEQINNQKKRVPGYYERKLLLFRWVFRFPRSLQSSFQMTVESNYVIVIATLSDWLKRLAPVFQPMRSKTKTNRTMYASFFPALRAS